MTQEEFERLQRRRSGAEEPKKAPRAEKSEDESPIEALLAVQIRDDGGMVPPERQFRPLDDRKFRCDFAWPSVRLIVEVDGAVHRIKSRFHADIEKQALLVLAGWTILRVGGREVRDGTAVKWVLEAYRQACARHLDPETAAR